MRDQRRITPRVLAVGIAGTALLVAGAYLGYQTWTGKTAKRTAVNYSAAMSPREIAVGLRESDARALMALEAKLRMIPTVDDARAARAAAGNDPSKPQSAAPAPEIKALSDADAVEWIEALGGLRAGFLKLSTRGRVLGMVAASRILSFYAVEPCPTHWVEALAPLHDMFTAGLADPDLEVRSAALNQVAQFWSWLPGRTPLPAEEFELASWKDGFIAQVTRRLGDREPQSRLAAIACLGKLPIDSAAAPAVAYIDDRDSAEVRQQVLASFASRPELLSDDVVLKRMYDTSANVAEVAEIVLRTRGLTREQIGLGRMIYHPRPELRASVIPMLKDRNDIDPVVWLLQLSRDEDESVRAGAAAALAERGTPEARRRLLEMASKDASKVVRQAAGKGIMPTTDTTAALPPLPDANAAGLKAKAN